jgi:hypothetical protein
MLARGGKAIAPDLKNKVAIAMVMGLFQNPIA